MTQPGDLQFDRAEPTAAAPAGTACVICKRPLAESYYEVNGKIVCPSCRARVLAAREAGTPAGRFARALLLGLGAALLGAALYFGVALATGYELGLIAVVMGFLVGGAVRKGSNGRGGWRYQTLAILLTYASVVAADGSIVVREFRQEWRAKADSVRRVAREAGPDSVAATAVSADSAPKKVGVAVAFALLFAFALAAPILIGISSPIHLLIVAFALYEAWKLNRAVPFNITGPYRVAAAT